MARSRYANNEIIDGKRYATWRNHVAERPDGNILDGVQTKQHMIAVGDRLDILAEIHLGSSSYWWVIALVNNIKWPLGIEPGTIIQIPRNVTDVISKLQR